MRVEWQLTPTAQPISTSNPEGGAPMRVEWH